MKTLHLYLTRQVFITLLMTVVVFTFVLLLGNLLKEIIALLVNHQATPLLVLKAIGLLIPFVLAFALPMGMLTATLLTFGRFSADQELTAARANGVSLLALVWPVFLLSLALSGLCAWFNLQFSQHCRVAYKELLAALSRQQPLLFLTEGRFNPVPGVKGETNYFIYVGKKDGYQLKDIMLSALNQTQVVTVARALSGTIEENAARREMTLYLTNCWGMTNRLVPPQFLAVDFLRTNELISQLRQPTNALAEFLRSQLSAASQAALSETNTNIVAAQEALIDEFNKLLGAGPLYEERRFQGVAVSAETRALLQTARTNVAELPRLNRLLLEDAFPEDLARCPKEEWCPFNWPEPEPVVLAVPPAGARRATAYSDMTFQELRAEKARLEQLPFRPATPTRPSAEQMRQDLRRTAGLQETMLRPITLQMHRQVAFSFACIGFTVIGIPLGIRAHRRETSVGIGLAILLVLIYYSFIILGQSLQTRSEWAPFVVWLPNFLFQGIGAVLLWRANRGA